MRTDPDDLPLTALVAREYVALDPARFIKPLVVLTGEARWALERDTRLRREAKADRESSHGAMKARKRWWRRTHGDVPFEAAKYFTDRHRKTKP
jgi:hypothetical protein